MSTMSAESNDGGVPDNPNGISLADIADAADTSSSDD